MSSKPFSIRIDDDLREKIQNMIDLSGLTSKEWLEKTIALAELNSIKEGSEEFKQDLSELEIHTGRIFELVSNMVQRSIFFERSSN